MRLQITALFIAALWCGLPAPAQEVSQTATPTVIRTETKVVLVDAVVMDKKGNYMPELAQKDFKIYEDNKEQPITSFTYEADPNSPANNQKHYLVLFFDNASVSTGNQMQARSAAEKFVDKNTGPNKFIAVVNFSGTLQIAQNFTNDPDRLMEVIKGVKTSTVSTTDSGIGGPRGPGGTASLGSEAQFGISSVLMGLRELAKRLADVPGRKMVVMLTEGFRLNAELQSEMAATIDACNKYNVSIYPVDVKGLAAPVPGMGPGPGGRGRIGGQNPLPMALFGSPSGTSLGSFVNSFQARGGGGVGGGGGTAGGGGGTAGGAAGGASSGGGGARGGGGISGGSTGTGGVGTGGARGGTGTGTGVGTASPGGGRGGTGTTGVGTGTGGRGPGGGTMPVNPSIVGRPPMNPRTIIPPSMGGIDANQDALYQLASGTGGFVIVNTNDLLGGMEKIAREQNQYYILGFTPAESAEGSCHTLHVKVDKGGTVRSRSGYCNVRQVDVLAGKPAETELEAIAVGSSPGKLSSPLQLPYFYASANVARVNVAMEIPSEAFKFEKQKGKLHAEMNVLGIAYRADNSVGAKFSDTLKFDYENKVQVEEFARHPVHYENQFDIGTGKYNFKVVFSTGGDNFGKIEKPLAVDPFDGKEFAVSDVALSKELRQTANDGSLDAVLIEDRVPLVAMGIQAIPAGRYTFDPSDNAAGIYFEVFEPGMTQEKPPDVFAAMRITDKKSGEEKISSGKFDIKQYERPGNPVIPVILKLPLKDLQPGSYQLEVGSGDSAGKGIMRKVDFDVQATTAPAVGWGKN